MGSSRKEIATASVALSTNKRDALRGRVNADVKKSLGIKSMREHRGRSGWLALMTLA
jgi:hypothetical protein